MTLSKQVNSEKILARSQEHAARHGRKNVHALLEHEKPHTDDNPRYDTTPIPKHHLPARSMDADMAYQLVHDELTLDGNPLLNLASFVHTWMPPQADKLMAENVQKNLIDASEYPATQLITNRCVSMLAKLWHADETKNATGTPTTGSSEAIQLAGLAMKRKWQEKMRAAGKDVALEKFARYFDVEARMVPVDASTNYCMSPKRAMEYVDENTIGIFVIMGSTYTGHFENVQEMSDLLDEYQAKTGIDVPIHVDGASGAFFAPFVYPNLKWDFRVKRVVSINASGHKWGKAYVGVGWAIWRDAAHLPKDMVFELSYLGDKEYSFSLNFSRPAAPIIAQYFNFIHLGFEGYRKISLHDAKNARLLARALENSKYYEVVSNIHRPASDTVAAQAGKALGVTDDIEYYSPGLPVVAFKFSAEFKKEYPHVKQKWIQTLLRSKSWIVPNYPMPPNVEDVEILRVVIREKFSEDLVERLVIDIIEITESLMTDESASTQVLEKHSNNSSHGKKEKEASSHGEGVKPTGHDSVC
ncbi:glutamate decarboxylase [Pseudohyphozyma bogoriensis]|nr:glutamate decarboxylase [Pseudohyphozyma bogoriensis]